MERLMGLLLVLASCLANSFTHLQIAAGADAAPSIRSMQWQRRIVLISASGTADVALSKQLEILSSWDGASERDISIVELVGDHVSGSSDNSTDLRRQYGLPAHRFTVILIGKDGHVALKSSSPLSTDVLSKTIDAMPMRRSGQSSNRATQPLDSLRCIRDGGSPLVYEISHVAVRYDFANATSGLPEPAQVSFLPPACV